MYQIRMYYVVNREVRYHIYNDYLSFDDAYGDFKILKEFYESIGEKSTCFAMLPKKLLNNFVLFLEKQEKDLFTIVKER